jgi:type II secretion system protein N
MALRERLRRFGKLGVVLGFGLLVFLVVLYLTLPYDRFKDYLAGQVSNYGYELEAREAGPSLGFGMTMRDVSLVSRPSGAGKPTRILVEKAKLTVSPLSYLMGGKSYSASVDVFGGEVEADVKIGKQASTVKATAAEINLAEIPWVKNLINLPASGRLETELDLAIPKQHLSESKGSLHWGCTACALGDGKAKLTIASHPLLAEGLGLPKIRLGDFRGKVEIDKGVGRLQNVQFKSPDLEATIEGEIHLAQPVASSRVDLYIRFKLSDNLLRSSEKLRTIMDLTTQMGKRPDGFLGLRMTGTFQHMGSVQWLKASPFVSTPTPHKGPATKPPPVAVHPPPPRPAPQPLPPSPPALGITPPAFPSVPAPSPPPAPPPPAPSVQVTSLVVTLPTPSTAPAPAAPAPGSPSSPGTPATAGPSALPSGAPALPSTAPPGTAPAPPSTAPPRAAPAAPSTAPPGTAPAPPSTAPPGTAPAPPSTAPPGAAPAPPSTAPPGAAPAIPSAAPPGAAPAVPTAAPPTGVPAIPGGAHAPALLLPSTPGAPALPSSTSVGAAPLGRERTEAGQ